MELKDIIRKNINEARGRGVKISDRLKLKNDSIDDYIAYTLYKFFAEHDGDRRVGWWYFQVKAILNVVSKDPSLVQKPEEAVREANQMIIDSGYNVKKAFIEKDYLISGLRYVFQDIEDNYGKDFFKKLKTMKKADMESLNDKFKDEAKEKALSIIKANEKEIIDIMSNDIWEGISEFIRSKEDASDFELKMTISQALRRRNINIRNLKLK